MRKILNINTSLVPIKMHYFLYSGCLATVLSFGSTYAKHLGYSKITVGYIMMSFCILSMLTKPAVGAIVDKFHIKKYMFLTFVLLTGVSAFFLMRVPKLPIKHASEIACNTTTIIKIYSEDGKELSFCDKKRLMRNDDKGLISCELKCNNSGVILSKMFNKTTDYYESTLPNELDGIATDNLENEETDILKVFLYLNNIELNQASSYDFRVKYVDINNSTRLTWPSCQSPTQTTCQMICFNKAIMELSSFTKSQKNTMLLPEFWQFFVLFSVFWVSQSVIWTIQDPICYDLLKDKLEDFGKQRCWTSIGWGIVAIFSGWLVDFFSQDDIDKNYTPVSYLIIPIVILNFIFASNIEINEFHASKNTFQNVFDLFSKFHVVRFFFWTFVVGLYSSVTMSYLFWYLEDMALQYECDQLPWMKTQQGLSQILQSFCGEVPIFFCSGWIIQKIGHQHCMSLVLVFIASRFFFYSIITNPAWVLLIETVNGMMYALGRAVSVSYSRMISPPSTNHTILGLVGLFDCIGLSLGGVLAAHVYEFYGGVWLFRSFSYSSAAISILHVVYNILAKPDENYTSDKTKT